MKRRISEEEKESSSNDEEGDSINDDEEEENVISISDDEDNESSVSEEEFKYENPLVERLKTVRYEDKDETGVIQAILKELNRLIKSKGVDQYIDLLDQLYTLFGDSENIVYNKEERPFGELLYNKLISKWIGSDVSSYFIEYPQKKSKTYAELLKARGYKTTQIYFFHPRIKSGTAFPKKDNTQTAQPQTEKKTRQKGESDISKSRLQNSALLLMNPNIVADNGDENLGKMCASVFTKMSRLGGDKKNNIEDMKTLKQQAQFWVEEFLNFVVSPCSFVVGGSIDAISKGLSYNKYQSNVVVSLYKLALVLSDKTILDTLEKTSSKAVEDLKTPFMSETQWRTYVSTNYPNTASMMFDKKNIGDFSDKGLKCLELIHSYFVVGGRRESKKETVQKERKEMPRKRERSKEKEEKEVVVFTPEKRAAITSVSDKDIEEIRKTGTMSLNSIDTFISRIAQKHPYNTVHYGTVLDGETFRQNPETIIKKYLVSPVKILIFPVYYDTEDMSKFWSLFVFYQEINSVFIYKNFQDEPKKLPIIDLLEKRGWKVVEKNPLDSLNDQGIMLCLNLQSMVEKYNKKLQNVNEQCARAFIEYELANGIIPMNPQFDKCLK